MLRDKFAMAAMQGFCANPDSHAQEWSTGEVAQYAYAQADAMMKERANWDFSKDPENIQVKAPEFVPPPQAIKKTIA